MRTPSLFPLLVLLTGCAFRQGHSIETVMLLPQVRAQIADEYAGKIQKLLPKTADTMEFEEPLTPFGKALIARLRVKGFPVYVSKHTKGSQEVCSYRIDSIGQGVIASSFSSPAVTLSRIYTVNANEVSPQGGFSVLRREHE